MTGPGPLAGARVLDPTRILGGLGAKVVKVEAPSGDRSRALPPHFVGPVSACYPSVNRNKRSSAASDVVMENSRPGVPARLGLAYEKLAAERPQLIWCSISGFGQDGPGRDRTAYDRVVHAPGGAAENGRQREEGGA